MYKSIPGFNKYAIDENGNIINKSNPNKLMKLSNDKDGYKKLSIVNDDGIERTVRAHRLVASVFIPNPENKPVVNHKNGIKYDNRVENLEWATIAENTQHSYDNGLQVSKASTPLLIYLDNNLISIFPTFISLSEHLGINRNVITDYIAKDKLLLGSLKVVVGDKDKDYSDNPLFENRIVSSSERLPSSSRTFMIGDEKFPNLKTASERLGLNPSKIQYALKNGKQINGLEVKDITHYEYKK